MKVNTGEMAKGTQVLLVVLKNPVGGSLLDGRRPSTMAIDSLRADL
jgi:hypothetical protein